MFIYDKDMQRVIEEKRKEFLRDMNAEKERILKELSECNKQTMTRLRGLQNQYNRIDSEIEEQVNSSLDRIADITAVKVMENILVSDAQENTFDISLEKGVQVTIIVQFPKPFVGVPVVEVEGVGEQLSYLTIGVTTITQTSFMLTLRESLKTQIRTIHWKAYIESEE